MNKTDFSSIMVHVYQNNIANNCNPDIWGRKTRDITWEIHTELKVIFKWRLNYVTSVKIRQPIIKNKYKVTKAQISKLYSKIKGQL